MKKIFFIIALSTASVSFSQLENAKWCFRNYARVNFSAISATVSNCASGAPMNYPASPSSVSDANGNLLFYTNGSTIWDKNNTIMPNGTGLNGYNGGYAQQSTLIVPKPNSANIYYVFTVNQGALFYGHHGFYYSVIDMCLNNGNGDVVVGKKNIVLNNDLGVPIEYNGFSNPERNILEARLSSTPNNDNTKIWVSLFARFGVYGVTLSDRFAYNYLVSDNGINGAPDGISTGPTTNATLPNSSFPNWQTDWGVYGHIKFSPNRNYLCDANSCAVTLYQFNNTTGTFQFPGINLYTSNINLLHNAGLGLEFSPNSQLLYFSTIEDILYQNFALDGDNDNPHIVMRIRQSNLMPKSGTIVIGEYEIPSDSIGHIQSVLPIPPNIELGGLQLAMNNIIYVCSNSPNYPPRSVLGAIENPNTPGTACNFDINELPLASSTSHEGLLPQWIHKTIFTPISPCQQIWPKVYTAKSPFYLNNDHTGNIILGMHEADLTAPMLNHSGFLPPNPTTNAEYTFHYNSTGLTNWAKTNLNPTFILNAGDLQLHSSSAIYPTSYINCTNGTTALPPILVPGNNETILAETNTGEIITTTTFGEIIAHSPNFPLPVTYNLGGGTIGKTIFDKSTNRIFFLRYNFPNYYFEIYTYIPLTHMFQQSHFSVLTGTGAELYQVDNSGNAYMLRSSILEKYNYSLPIPTFTAVTINGFNNQNLIGAVSHNRYTENTCIAIQQSESNLYSLNLAAQSYKKISITNLTNSAMYTYSNDGNIVYIAAHIEGTGISLGSYAIPTLIPFTTSTFLMKLDLNVDFTSRPSSSEIVETKSYFHVRLSPNPTKSSIKLIITENKKQSNSTFTIFIVNQAGNTLIKKENYVSGHSLDISILQTGSYFIEIVNNRGEKISKSIIKL